MDNVKILKQLSRVEKNMNHWAKDPMKDENISMMFVSLTLISNLIQDIKSDESDNNMDIITGEDIDYTKWLSHVMKFEDLFKKSIEDFKINEIEILIYSMLPSSTSEFKAYINLLKNINNNDLNNELKKIKN